MGLEDVVALRAPAKSWIRSAGTWIFAVAFSFF